MLGLAEATYARAGKLSRQMGRVPRALLIALVLGVGVMALLPGPQHSNRSVEASADTTTILHDGSNLLGWLKPDTFVEEVFAAIPELTSISDGTRHARRDGLASPDAASLSVLETGRGYWFQIRTEQPVLWEQAATVERPTVILQPGPQLVAWSGRSGMTFASAIRGVSDVIERAWTWDAWGRRMRIWSPTAPNGFDLLLPIPHHLLPTPNSSGSQLSRGQAVGLVVRHPVEWHQPTGIVPSIDFVGHVPERIQDIVRTDMEWVVHSFGDSFGVEAIADLTKVVVPATSADLVGHERLTGPTLLASAHIPPDPLHSTSTILMPMAEWAQSDIAPQPDGSSPGRQVLLHEYYHVVQAQLAGPRVHDVEGWLVEAGPTWVQITDHSQITAHQDQLEMAARFQLGQDAIPYLERNESDLSTLFVSPTHAIGYAVTYWMTEHIDADAHIRFWRNFTRMDLRHAGWDQVFDAAFSISLDQMYQRYESWLRPQFPYIEGRVINHSRFETADLYLGLAGPTALSGAQIELSDDGTFRTVAAIGGPYEFGIASPDHTCMMSVISTGVVTESAQAVSFHLTSDGLTGLAVTVPAGYCDASVSGRVVDHDGEPFAGLELSLCDRDIGCAEGWVDDVGSFRLGVPEPGSYRLRVYDPALRCALYYHTDSARPGIQDATPIQVGVQAVSDLHVELPRPLCGYLIEGQLENLPSGWPQMHMYGLPFNELNVNAIGLGHGATSDHSPGTISADGSFAIHVPSVGHYGLRLKPQHGSLGHHQAVCEINYRYGPHSLQYAIILTEDGHDPIEWRIPNNFCRYTVGGLLTDEEHEPLPFIYVQACQTNTPGIGNQCGAAGKTDANGRFMLYVPYRGKMSIALGTTVLQGSETDQCGYSYRGRGHQTHLVMNDGPVDNIQLSVPRDLVCLD